MARQPVWLLAGEAAKEDAAFTKAGGMATAGSAVSEAGVIDRVETVKKGGKCWSVAEARAAQGEAARTKKA